MCHAIDDRLSLEQALQNMRSEFGGTLVDALSPILRINEQRNRLCRYLHLNPQETIQTYVLQVAHYYEMDCYYLKQVQQQQNAEVWEPLMDKIRQWSYSFLGRWHLEEVTRMTYTFEIAQEAGLQITHAHYPYDCEFDAWACKLTHYVSSKYMQRHGSSPIIDEVDLAEVDERLQDRVQSTDANPELKFAIRQLLVDAIEQLSNNQKVVIWQFYFEGFPLPKIAEDLDINVNAIYKRHFDALKQLRKILEEDKYKDE